MSIAFTPKKQRVTLLAITLTIATSISLCPKSFANPVYKYTDSNGVITYSDKALPGSKVVDFNDEIVEHIETQVKLQTIKHNGGETLKVKNELFAPVEIELTLADTENVVGAANKKLRWVLPPRSNIRLVTLTPYDAKKPMRYKPSLKYALGNPNSTPIFYRYPLAWRGGPFYQSQGPGGKYSHSGIKGRYARDIAMPEGTTIIAARAGIVVKVENNQTGRGKNPSGNFVRILHNDGTMSVYLHLLRRSVIVQEGQQVNVGQKIALSGNTGNSTGPHLHFVIQQNKGMSLESIPFEFAQPVNRKPISTVTNQ